MEKHTADTASSVLNLKLGRNDAGAPDVRAYMKALLEKLFQDGECFNGKRPFGNSGGAADASFYGEGGGMITFTPGKSYPIDTATDAMASGAHILVWVPAVKRWCVATWNRDLYVNKPRPYWDMEGFPNKSWSRDRQPTRWMPMPPAPEEGQ